MRPPAPPGSTLGSDDLLPHFQAWQAAPSPPTAGAFLRAAAPVIDGAVRGAAGPRGGSPLLRSKAKAIVLDALPHYDPARGPLKAYLGAHLQGLRRAAADEAEAISLPEQVRLDRHHLFEAEGRLRDRLGRDPDDVELADETGLSLRRLGKIRQADTGLAEGQAVAAGDAGPEPFDPAVRRRPGAADDAAVEFVYQGLGPTDRLILEHTLGLQNKRVLENRRIAQMLRLTPAAVSQRKLKLQQQIDRVTGAGVF